MLAATMLVSSLHVEFFVDSPHHVWVFVDYRDNVIVLAEYFSNGFSNVARTQDYDVHIFDSSLSC